MMGRTTANTRSRSLGRQSLALLLLTFLFAPLASGQANKILVLAFKDHIDRFQRAAPNYRVIAVDQQTALEHISEAVALVGGATQELIQKGKNLKWVQVGSAGVENYLAWPELRNSDIVLTNCKIIQGPEIADHAFALLLALTRELPKAFAFQQQASWQRQQFHPVELHGKTAVVVGVGGIGTQIAQRAHAFGMRVLGVDPKDIPMTYFWEHIVPPDRLNDVLPEADVVFVAAPHTPQTEKMFKLEQFNLMKKGSYFVAVSRGKLYDLNALMQAIDSGHLAGAGLDVTDPEPLPPDHPAWKFPNIVITPHVAGMSDQVSQRRVALYEENIRRFAEGKPLLNVVDKQKGY